MLDESRVSVVTPVNAADIYALADDIATVAKAYRRGAEDESVEYYAEFIDWLATVPHVLTMVYVDDKPAAWVRIDSNRDNPDEVGRKVLEFSGVCLPAYEGTGLTELIAPIAIDHAFARTGRSKMIAVIDAPNPKAVAALERLGFEFRDTDADGKRIYRLKRAKQYVTARSSA